jgi:hypothetical protein
VVAADDGGLGTTVAPEWIVCNASARSVVDGVVVCPLGIFSPWAHCLECRFLEGAEGDRERSCSVETTAAAADDRPELPMVDWAELIVELL